jgi:hypothetical protein
VEFYYSGENMDSTNSIVRKAALALFDIDLAAGGSLNLVMWADVLSYLSWLGVRVDLHLQDLNSRLQIDGHDVRVELKSLPASLKVYEDFVVRYVPEIAPALIDTVISELRKLGACGVDWPIDPESIVAQYESIKEKSHAS